MNDIWKTVRDFPDYEVNEDGEVRNKETKIIIKHQIKKNSSCQVRLYKNGVAKNVTISRIVADAFIEPLTGDKCVGHLNGDRLKNRATNLFVGTRKDIMRHCSDIGTLKPGDYGRKRIKVRVIETGKIYRSLKSCAVDIGCHQSEISSYLNGFRKSVRGYHFEQID